MKNNYKNNHKLHKLIKNSITNIDIPKEVRPLIIEILKRRYLEFDFSDDEIIAELIRLSKNLKTIKFGKIPDEEKGSDGLFFQDQKKILINEESLSRANSKNKKLDVCETIAHELFHALSIDDNGNDILESQNQFFDVKNTSLKEAIIEKASERCICPRDASEQTAPYFHQTFLGYSDITFITDIIGAAYGVSEKEFLKNALRGRAVLIDFLSKKANETPSKTTLFLDSIELNFNRLYSAQYPFADDEKLSLTTKRNDVIDTVSSIYTLCEYKLLDRMIGTNFETDRKDIAKTQIEHIKFDHNKITSVMEHALKKFDLEYFYAPISKSIKTNAAESIDYTVQIINIISEIIDAELESDNSMTEKIDGGLEPDVTQTLIQYVLVGVDDEEMMEKANQYMDLYNINPKPVDKMFDISEECKDEKIKENFEDVNWDNTELLKIGEYIISTFKRNRTIKEYFINMYNKTKRGLVISPQKIREALLKPKLEMLLDEPQDDKCENDTLNRYKVNVPELNAKDNLKDDSEDQKGQIKSSDDDYSLDD